MMQNGESVQPKIALIMPVYQNEKTLYECMISVIAQKIEETEVIAVDDGSTDQSRAVLEVFQAAYPGKVKCIYFDEHRGLDAACRAGVEAACAPYVTFITPEGIANGLLSELLASQAEAEETDILFYPYVKYNPVAESLSSVVPSTKKLAQADMMKSESISFWFALFRKSFLLEHADVAFSNLNQADAVVMPQLIARTDRLGSVRRAGLFLKYEKDMPEVSYSSEKEVQDAIAADQRVWEQVPASLQASLASHYARYFSVRLKDEPATYDCWVRRTKAMADRLNAYRNDKDPAVDKLFNVIDSLAQDIQIPRIVYVNGFMKQQIIDFDSYLEQAKSAYLFDPQVVVLDEETCDISELPAWLQNAEPEDKGLYFAIERIHQTGGMYIAPTVVMVTSFNREAYSEAFFTAGAAHQALPCAFGAKPGHPILRNMLSMLREERDEPSLATVAGRMTCVLIRDTGVHLNGKMEQGLSGVHILPFAQVCHGPKAKNKYSRLNYNNLRMSMQQMVCLPQELESKAWEKVSLPNRKGSEADNAAGDIQKLTAAQEELLQIKSSKAWKVVTRLYATRDNFVDKLRSLKRKLRGK